MFCLGICFWEDSLFCLRIPCFKANEKGNHKLLARPNKRDPCERFSKLDSRIVGLLCFPCKVQPKGVHLEEDDNFVEVPCPLPSLEKAYPHKNGGEVFFRGYPFGFKRQAQVSTEPESGPVPFVMDAGMREFRSVSGRLCSSNPCPASVFGEVSFLGLLKGKPKGPTFAQGFL